MASSGASVPDILQSLRTNWVLAQSEHMSKVPLYHQLYSVLKSAIVDGTISYNAQLPTEHQLVDAFDVSRITVKRAMDELAAEKLISRYRGKGTHVIYEYSQNAVKAPLVATLQNFIELGRQSTSEAVVIERVVPPAEIRAQFGLPDDEVVDHVIRVHSNQENEPYAYYNSWTPGVVEGFTKKNLETSTRLELLRSAGLNIVRVEQYLSAELSNDDTANALGVEKRSALLSIRRKSFDDVDKLVDIVDCLYNPKRFQYAMELSLD